MTCLTGMVRSPVDRGLPEAEDDARLGGVVRRHFHLDPVANHQANEALAHFPGNVSEDLVPAGQLHLEHRTSQNCGDGPLHFHRLLLVALLIVAFLFVGIITTPATVAAASSSKITWSGDNSVVWD